MRADRLETGIQEGRVDCVQALLRTNRAGQRDFGQHCGGRILRDIGHGQAGEGRTILHTVLVELPAQILTVHAARVGFQ
ncbi:Uncharacterised protein [Mycobacterium tuberculosis]|uniref:Uncharacterized protein n=1 Tax=Mycobacterium tuberculosis TaxID=1773 RepID=A0A655ALJ3_MYCTX|nr:Uncharacterised protein [Mycobacterium tuberculosis]CFE36078.1 Uncharacterised protein [Mycobacterium tuberculosis]CFE47087.1 Uncharacterised protein [Mycobacterium tuberculosis]CFR82390.1 Uncharacterised protein [Mycobacterium tuberculosis]CKO46127.1 Uncharacterised protein [Mycobacterium tuberculosis]